MAGRLSLHHERQHFLLPWCEGGELLAYIVRTPANKGMARDLGLSQRTVEIHRARVIEKMEARSIAQLVRMALDAGLLKDANTA